LTDNVDGAAQPGRFGTVGLELPTSTARLNPARLGLVGQELPTSTARSKLIRAGSEAFRPHAPRARTGLARFEPAQTTPELNASTAQVHLDSQSWRLGAAKTAETSSCWQVKVALHRHRDRPDLAPTCPGAEHCGHGL